jgi:hypothetical protein
VIEKFVAMATKGSHVVDHRPAFSTLSARYDDFLYAPICDEPNGMRLSVISALARMNVDPWDEAKRLAAMPKAMGERALVSILGVVSGSRCKSPEAEVIAAQLIRLLPQSGEGATTAAARTAVGAAKSTSYWWVWVCLALAMSYLMPHQPTTSANPGTPTSQSGPSQPEKADVLVPPKSSVTSPNAVGISR